MSKLKLLVFFVFIGCFVCISPKTQAQGEYQLRLNPGMMIPTSDFSNIAGNAYGLDLGFSVFLKQSLALSLDVGYYAYEKKGVNEIQEAYKGIPLSITADFLFRNDKKFHPLIGGGMTYLGFRQKVHGDYADFTDTEGKVGFVLKAGACYDIDEKWSIGVNGRYFNVITYSHVSMNLSVGFRL